MTPGQDTPRVVSASREIAAEPGRIFELIADPAAQPRWDGNDNLARAPAGQRVCCVGDVFTMTLTRGAIRENHVVEFDEGRRIAWMPEPAFFPNATEAGGSLPSTDTSTSRSCQGAPAKRCTGVRRRPR